MFGGYSQQGIPGGGGVDDMDQTYATLFNNVMKMSLHFLLIGGCTYEKQKPKFRFCRKEFRQINRGLFSKEDNYKMNKS